MCLQNCNLYDNELTTTDYALTDKNVQIRMLYKQPGCSQTYLNLCSLFNS